VDSLIAAKQKLGVGVLKNKQQLVHALEKAAGQELAEKAKQEAVSAALQKTKAFIEEQTAKVVLPAGPEQFASFMASVHDAGRGPFLQLAERILIGSYREAVPAFVPSSLLEDSPCVSSRKDPLPLKSLDSGSYRLWPSLRNTEKVDCA